VPIIIQHNTFFCVNFNNSIVVFLKERFIIDKTTREGLSLCKEFLHCFKILKHGVVIIKKIQKRDYLNILNRIFLHKLHLHLN